jgi:hypothetical protein
MRDYGMKGVSIVLVAALAPLCGCNRDDQEIKVYKVAKAPLETTTPAPEAAMPTNASSPSVLAANVPGLTSTATAEAPKNWEPQPLTQMREASFIVRGESGATADISLVRLGPAAGNVLDNVNRWLGQLKQPAVTEEKLRSMIQPLGDAAVVDLSGQPENGDPAKDGRIVGAIASDENGTAFYKMRGNAALVGAEKENFLKWVSASRGSTTSTSMSAPATATTTPASSESDLPQIKWELPSGWSTRLPSAMRYASFSAEKNGESADISVVTFPGDGGSDVDNVNRWRQQIRLPAVGEELLKPMIAAVHAGDVHIDVIDMSGPSARVIAGWTRQRGHAWFFKMTGPPQLIEEEKPKFMAFLQSIRF